MSLSIFLGTLAIQATTIPSTTVAPAPKNGDLIEVETATAIMLPDLLAKSMMPLVSCLFSETRPSNCEEARSFALREAKVALGNPLSEHDRNEIVQVLIANVETLTAHDKFFQKLNAPDLTKCLRMTAPGPTPAWRCAPRLPDALLNEAGK